MRLSRSVLIGCVILILILPFLPLVIWSVAQGWYFPQLLPQQWSGQGWAAIFSPTSKVGTGFAQSLVIAAITTLSSVIIGLPAGRALGLHHFPGKGALKLILLLPIIVSPLATLMGIQFVLIRLKLLGTIAGVVLVHLMPTIPYMTLVTASVFTNFDRAYEAQARSLGAHPWQVLWQITLPIVSPGVMVGALFAFLLSWNEFLLTFMVGSGRVLTLPMVLFTSLQGGNNGLMAAIALTSLLPAMLFLLLVSQSLQDETAALGGLGSV